MLSKLKNSFSAGREQQEMHSDIEFLETVAGVKGFEQELGDIYVCILFDLLLYKYP